MRKNETSNGKKGGLLKGKPHYDKNGKPLGGIKAIVTDTNTPVELEGGEVIINKEASKKYWKELSRINQSAGNGVPIKNPNGGADEDPEEYKDGGRIIDFNPNHLPNKRILTYAKNIKSKYPKVWDLGGNIFGNEAFKNLQRVSERGYWLESEKWMYIKWRSFVARHTHDFRINGVIAMLKWVDKVDKGWEYMKNLIEAEIEKKYPSKMEKGGQVQDLINNGFVELKMFGTKPKHAKEYGLDAINPLYIQNIYINKDERLKGIGSKVLNYIDAYAIHNGHDVVFGHITEKAEFTKDSRKTRLSNVEIIKNWLKDNGYSINENNNDFYKIIEKDKMKKGGNVVTYKNKFNKKYGFDLNESHSLEEIAKLTKIKLSSLQDIYDKGIGAYKTNPESVRPNVKSKEQWAMARVYSAVMGGKASIVDRNELSRGKMNKGGLIAPNGKESNLTPDQYKLVRTKAFKDWFGDWENDPENASKVVDENGEPLVCYHGTKKYNRFNVFRKGSKGYLGGGIYFTSDKDKGKTYGKYGDELINFYEVFLCIFNPLNVKGGKGADDLLNQIYGNKNIYFKRSQKQSFDTMIVTSKDINKLRDKGYDGIFWKLADEFVVYEPNQIKLADGSNTTFDEANADIRFNDGGNLNTFASRFPKNEWIQLSKKTRDEFADNIAKLIVDSYSKKGGNFDIQNGNDVRNSDLDVYMAKDIDEDPDIDVVMAGKNTKFGKKITIIAQDGTLHSKRILIKDFENFMIQGGFYTEVDVDMAEAMNVHILTNEQRIKEVLNKEIFDYNPKNGSYKREIKGFGLKTKVLVGFPMTKEEMYFENGGELAKGIKSEKEHIGTAKKLYNREITPEQSAKEIAKDHLKENKNYYSLLQEMESKFKDGGNIESDKIYQYPSKDKPIFWQMTKKQFCDYAKSNKLDLRLKDSDAYLNCEDFYKYMVVGPLLSDKAERNVFLLAIESNRMPYQLVEEIIKSVDMWGFNKKVMEIVAYNNQHRNNAEIWKVPKSTYLKKETFLNNYPKEDADKWYKNFIYDNVYVVDNILVDLINRGIVKHSDVIERLRESVGMGSLSADDKAQLDKLHKADMLKVTKSNLNTLIDLIDSEKVFNKYNPPIKDTLSDNEITFIDEVSKKLGESLKAMNKTQLEKLGNSLGIESQNDVKELVELAISKKVREIAHTNNLSILDKYDEIETIYLNQPNLSHRTSQSTMMQQYSTPCTIGYLMGLYCGIDKKGTKYFEPSAGNGLLVSAGYLEDGTLNELDKRRNENLHYLGFKNVTNLDASKPFPQYEKTFDAVLTNPPFGSTEPVYYGKFEIKSLEMLMALRGLDTMKDDGKCAIIIGGHMEYDSEGRLKAGKNKSFFVYLYQNYYIEDIININGRYLYSKQGTSFNTRLILINGRKKEPNGIYPLMKEDKDVSEAFSIKPVNSFSGIFDRINYLINIIEY
jgi:GNAT superfamily N-acetyltransferase